MGQQIEARSLDVEGVPDGQEKVEGIMSLHSSTPCVGMIFSSAKEVHEFYKSYAHQLGFGIVKMSTKNDDDGQRRYYSLACHKGGNRRLKGRMPLTARTSVKTGCKAKINIRVSNEGTFIISKVCLDHNHALSPKKMYREYSEEEMRYCKLCSKVHKLAELGAESQENYDFLLKWMDEVLAKLMNKLVSKTIDVDNVSVELGSEAEKGNQHISSVVMLSPLEEQAKDHPAVKRKQSIVKNDVEKDKRSKKEVLQEEQYKQSHVLQPLKKRKEATSVAAQRGKTEQKIEAKSVEIEGVTNGQEKVEEIIKSHLSTPCVGMIFSSEIEAYEFYKSYAHQLGFGIVKMSTKNDDDGQRRYYSLACHKGGNRRLKGRLPMKARPSVKTGCKAKINIRVSSEGSFIVSKVCLDHNHALSPYTRCGHYVDEEDEMMEEKHKRSEKKVMQEQSQDMQPLEKAEKGLSVAATDQRGETSTEMTISIPVVQQAFDPTSAHSTHNAPLITPPQPLPMPVPLTIVWPTLHPNLHVVSRAATHLDVSQGSSLSGNVRPNSHSQPTPFYINLETNKDWMSH